MTGGRRDVVEDEARHDAGVAGEAEGGETVNPFMMGWGCRAD